MTLESRRPRRQPTARWKILVPIALVVAGVIAFMLLYTKPEDAVHDDANPGGALHGKSLADVEAKYGHPVKTSVTKESLTANAASDVDVTHLFYGGTDVWIVDGKVYKATNRAERIAEAEGKK